MMEWYISCPSRIVTARNGFPMNFQKHAQQKTALKQLRRPIQTGFPMAECTISFLEQTMDRSIYPGSSGNP